MKFHLTNLCVGGILYPIVFHQLQPRIGFGWATRVIGFIVLGTLIVSLMLIKPRVKASGNVRRVLDFGAFRSPAFSIFTFATFFYFLGLYFPFLYVSAWAQHTLKLDASIASYLFSVLNGGSVFGRIIAGLVADRVGSLNAIIPCLLVTSVLAFAWISIKSLATLIIFCFFYGFFSGATISLPPTIVAAIAEDNTKVGTWMGMRFGFAALGLLVGNPIAGAIVGNNEHFVAAQCFSGATVMVATIMTIGVRWIAWRDGNKLTARI